MEVAGAYPGVHAGLHQQFRCNEAGDDQQGGERDVQSPRQRLEYHGQDQQAGQQENHMGRCHRGSGDSGAGGPAGVLRHGYLRVQLVQGDRQAVIGHDPRMEAL